MKNLLLLLICVFPLVCMSQTRDVDIDYIRDHFIQGKEDDSYSVASFASSEFMRDGLKCSLQFFRVSTTDSKKRGLAAVYREVKNDNEVNKILVVCLPENNSDPAIKKKCFQAILGIEDRFVSTSIMWGLAQKLL